jgi:hypothetical protein
MLSIADITLTSLDTISAFKLDGEPAFIMDELQNATIANTQDKQDITGKGGRKLSSLKRNKAVTVSGTNGLISAGMLEVQTGSEFEMKESTPVAWTDYIAIEGDKAKTTYIAAGEAGKEIEALYIKNGDGSCGVKLEQAAAAAEGKFAYNPTTKELSFVEDAFDDGTEIVVFYTRNIPGAVLTNMSDKYSGKLQLYIDATGEDRCGKEYHVQFYIPKADFSGEFSIELGGDQVTHGFEAESLAGSNCGGVKGGELWTYTVFGVDAEDAQ